ncbi:RloB family protein [Candidatus Marithrix sp. Canyon 246]|uniref:RloB family protein n=1 Tax=Candidatus Marithrix sp. Canyon 246 TaxID=1827136 RepID=UPI00084A1325|nr:RloB family protein [Candidatus Marithrix sp. Canyon 246]
MARERKKLERISAVRDARLFIIATEGEQTEKQYFEDLVSKNWYGYFLALSNPCFELWLLLHIKSLEEYPDNALDEFLENKKVSSSRTRLEAELINLLNSYNKSNLDTAQFLPFVKQAIERAKKLDTNPKQRWSNGLGTRVYQLVEKIIVG